MKKFNITVNGQAYEVEVEEVGGASAPISRPAPKAAAPAGAQGAVKISAPMPGKILGVKANAGDAVKKGQVIVVLEAMKMENDIVAPQDGTVASINVTAGQSVESGAVLATMN